MGIGMKDLNIYFFHYIENRKMGMNVANFPINTYDIDNITFLNSKNDKFVRDKMKDLFDKIKNDKKYVYRIVYDGLYASATNKPRYYILYDTVKDRKRKLKNILEE